MNDDSKKDQQDFQIKAVERVDRWIEAIDKGAREAALALLEGLHTFEKVGTSLGFISTLAANEEAYIKDNYLSLLSHIYDVTDLTVINVETISFNGDYIVLHIEAFTIQKEICYKRLMIGYKSYTDWKLKSVVRKEFDKETMRSKEAKEAKEKMEAEASKEFRAALKKVAAKEAMEATEAVAALKKVDIEALDAVEDKLATEATEPEVSINTCKTMH